MTSERTIKQKVAAKDMLTVPWSIICIIATAESSIKHRSEKLADLAIGKQGEYPATVKIAKWQ